MEKTPVSSKIYPLFKLLKSGCASIDKDYQMFFHTPLSLVLPTKYILQM